jgi:hypothetical protein
MARRTRSEKAKELLRLLNEGPHMALAVFGVADQPKLTKEQEAAINAKIRNWHTTWVIPLVRNLVKELAE